MCSDAESKLKKHNCLFALPSCPALGICTLVIDKKRILVMDLLPAPFSLLLHSYAHALVLLRKGVAPRVRKKD